MHPNTETAGKKAGYKTSEFWLSLVTALAPWLAPLVPQETAAIVSGVAGAVYAIARAITKAH